MTKDTMVRVNIFFKKWGGGEGEEREEEGVVADGSATVFCLDGRSDMVNGVRPRICLYSSSFDFCFAGPEEVLVSWTAAPPKNFVPDSERAGIERL